MKITLLSVAAVILTAAHAICDPVSDHKVLVLKNTDGVAILGYDPVSYFVDRKAAKGDPKFQSEFEGAKFYFTTAEHKALFDSMPSKYAPAYGGYCGYAASIGKVRPTDPRVWSLVDGKLILQNSKSTLGLWEKDVSGSKAKADANWPKLVEAKAGQKDPIDGLFGRSVLAGSR